MEKQKDSHDFYHQIFNKDTLEPMEYQKFCQTFIDAKGLTEKKRAYMSDYNTGYDNVKEYLNLETDELRNKDNFDRYSFDGVVEWWKNKASKRYESLNALVVD